MLLLGGTLIVVTLTFFPASGFRAPGDFQGWVGVHQVGPSAAAHVDAVTVVEPPTPEVAAPLLDGFSDILSYCDFSVVAFLGDDFFSAQKLQEPSHLAS